MNEQILDYFDSEGIRLAKDYVNQNESIKDRLISYLIENDKITEEDILDFCEDVNDQTDFHKFVEDNYHGDMERLDGLAYEAWKERQDK